MSNSITVRDIDPGDKPWLKGEAGHVSVSMEEFVRRLIHDKRIRTESRPKPSEVFARHFGEDNGVELPIDVRCGYKPPSFSSESGKGPPGLHG